MEQQVDVLRHAQAKAGVPAGAVEHEHDLLARAGADHFGEGGELDFEGRDGDAGGEVEERTARGRVDEADEVPPGETVLGDGGRALPD